MGGYYHVQVHGHDRATRARQGRRLAARVLPVLRADTATVGIGSWRFSLQAGAVYAHDVFRGAGVGEDGELRRAAELEKGGELVRTTDLHAARPERPGETVGERSPADDAAGFPHGRSKLPHQDQSRMPKSDTGAGRL